MDSEGYPEEKELRMIRKWDVKEFPSLLQFIEERWTYHDFIKRDIVKERGNSYLQWTLITGGWSGNEGAIAYNGRCYEQWPTYTKLHEPKCIAAFGLCAESVGCFTL